MSAGRVELNDEALGILRLRFANTARNVTRRGGTDRAVDFDEANFLPGSARQESREPQS